MSLVRTRLEVIDNRTFTVQDLENDTATAFNQTNDKTYKRLAPKILKSFQEYPDVPRGKFIWSDNPTKDRKARAWWFIYLRITQQYQRGNTNRRYKRTNVLKNSWRVQPINDNQVAGFSVSSNAVGKNPLSDNFKGFPYRPVVGTFSQRTGRGQAVSHRNRWFVAQDRARFWQEEYVDEFQKEYPNILAQVRNR